MQPLAPTVSDAKLHALIRLAVRQELDSKQCSLWADWELTRADRKTLAVDWMVKEFERILVRMNDGTNSVSGHDR